jgi:hypothetical protein
MSSRSIVSASSLLVCVLVLLFGAAPAHAGRRVVVLDFSGPKADRFHQDVEDAIRKNKHTIVSVDDWNAKAEDLGASKVNARNIQKVARKLKVEGVVVGEVEKRGQRYYVHLRLREGASGEYVAEVEIVVRQGKLGSDGVDVIKEELLPAIKELSKLGGRSDGAEEDDDEDADDEPRGTKGKKKSGFGRHDDDDDEDADPDDADADDAADDDDEDEAPVKKTKKQLKAEAAAKKKADAAAKKKAKAEAKAQAKADAKEKAEAAKKAKEKKRKAELAAADDDEDADADDDADEDSDDDRPVRKGKKGKRITDDDEDSDEDDGDDRVAAEDDEDVGVDEDTDRPRARGEVEDSPFTRPVDVAAGLSVTARRLAFTPAAGAAPVQGYRGNPVAGAVITADIYPLAFNKKNHSFTRNLGLTLMFDRVVKIQSRLEYDDNGTTMTAVLGTTQQRYSAGLLYRMPFGDKLAVIGSLRYSRMSFAIDKAAAPPGVTVQIPNVDYAFVDPGLAVRYLAGPKLVVGGGAGVGAVLGTGEMQNPDQYGGASVLGLEVDACADYYLTPKIVIRADAKLTSFGFSFKGNGTMSDPNADGTIDVPSGRDTYFGATATAAYQF